MLALSMIFSRISSGSDSFLLFVGFFHYITNSMVYFSLFYQYLYLNSKPISIESDLIFFSYINYIFCCVKKYTTFRVNACSKKNKVACNWSLLFTSTVNTKQAYNSFWCYFVHILVFPRFELWTRK